IEQDSGGAAAAPPADGAAFTIEDEDIATKVCGAIKDLPRRAIAPRRRGGKRDGEAELSAGAVVQRGGVGGIVGDPEWSAAAERQSPGVDQIAVSRGAGD